MPTIYNLQGLWRPLVNACLVLERSIAADDLDLRMSQQPCAQGLLGAVRQQVNGFVLLQIDQEGSILTAKQIKSISEFAERIGKGIKSAQTNPKYKRQIIEALDVRVIFAIENGEKLLYAQCVLDSEPDKFGIPSTTKR